MSETLGPSLWNDEQERPIQHIRVIDMTVMVPGPYVTRILAQYGADVIKVEALPDGDHLRHVKQSKLFDVLNQGKRSVAVNLKKEEGREIIRRLAAEADVFIENFREGVMDRMGLGYADLTEENPDLIYVSQRGLGGKHTGQPAHDLNFIAASGVGEWFLESGVPNYSTHFGDIVGALVPAIKLMMHLANPARRGMHIISHMDESFRSLFLPRAYDSFRAEELPENDRKNFGLHHALDGTFPNSRYYRCRDGQWVSLNAIQDKHWASFCEAVDKRDWKAGMWDSKLVPEVEKLFMDAPASYWETLSQNREVCLTRVIPWGEHFAFSQARPLLATDPLAWAGFSPSTGLNPAPPIGSDTLSVLGSIGASQKEIAEWMKQEIVMQNKK